MVEGVQVDSGTAGTTFQVLQQSGGRSETMFAFITGNTIDITERMVFQGGQMLFQVLCLGKSALANVASVFIIGI